jgi:hypothetical protein
MKFVTADGRTFRAGLELLEESPVTPGFAASLREAIADEYEQALQDGSASKHDTDWSLLGQQQVGAEQLAG